MHDKIFFSRCCRPRGIRAGEPRNGAAGDLQSRLLRAVLSKRQLPEFGTGKSLHRQLSAARRLPAELQPLGYWKSLHRRLSAARRLPADRLEHQLQPLGHWKSPTPAVISSASPTSRPAGTTATTAGTLEIPTPAVISRAPPTSRPAGTTATTAGTLEIRTPAVISSAPPTSRPAGTLATIAGTLEIPTPAVISRAPPTSRQPRPMRPSTTATAVAITASPMPSKAGWSARRAPGTGAKTAAGTSANRVILSRFLRKRRLAGRLFRTSRHQTLARFWPFARKSDIRPAERGAKCQPAFARHPPFNSRLSSAVEQRFCKPKVGGSIPSAGTIKTVPLYGR